jgi:AraC-like DNA-binding protein
LLQYKCSDLFETDNFSLKISAAILIKKDTGKSAQEYIQLKLMDLAKEKIFDKSKSVSQIAYELGFKYPQHFTRAFKQHVGHSPNEYRMLN